MKIIFKRIKNISKNETLRIMNVLCTKTGHEEGASVCSKTNSKNTKIKPSQLKLLKELINNNLYFVFITSTLKIQFIYK